MSILSSFTDKAQNTGQGMLDKGATAVGFGNKKQKQSLEESRQLSDAQRADMTGQSADITSAGKDYMGGLKSSYGDYTKQRDQYTSDYLKGLSGLQDQATSQANDARKTYSTDIQPRMKGMMEDAQKEASGAMTLAEAGDPNNAVAKSVRDMYEQQAVAEGNRGKADVGVLSSLGAQATAQQLGGMPALTGSGMQLLQARNMSQASGAYTNAQNRMQGLRDQGLNQGFAQSSAQYDRGQAAKDRYTKSVGNFEGSMNNNLAREKDFRGEQEGYDATKMGVGLGNSREDLGFNQGLAGQQYGINQADTLRNMGISADYYGSGQTAIQNQIAMQNADASQRRGILGGMITAGSAAAGGVAGGPQGAAQGAQAGSAVSAGFNNPQSNANYQAPGNYSQRYAGYAQ